jgi:hypothetical protein
MASDTPTLDGEGAKAQLLLIVNLGPFEEDKRALRDSVSTIKHASDLINHKLGPVLLNDNVSIIGLSHLLELVEEAAAPAILDLHPK